MERNKRKSDLICILSINECDPENLICSAKSVYVQLCLILHKHLNCPPKVSQLLGIEAEKLKQVRLEFDAFPVNMFHLKGMLEKFANYDLHVAA